MKLSSSHKIAFLLASLLGANMAMAQQADEISTDRPDFVESSEVVGKGRIQIETGFSLERNTANGSRDRQTTTPTLLRIGIEEDWELRFETDGKTKQTTERLAGGATQKTSGYSDLSVGLKWHMMDAQGVLPAVAVLIHADVDSGSTAFRGQGMRPSVRFTEEWELPYDISLGIMEGIMLDKNELGQRFNSGIFGITMSKGWTEKFRTFIEFASPQIARAQNGGSQASFDLGATYLLTPTLQLDTALFKGLNRRTPDLTFGVGLSAKF